MMRVCDHGHVSNPCPRYVAVWACALHSMKRTPCCGGNAVSTHKACSYAGSVRKLPCAGPLLPFCTLALRPCSPSIPCEAAAAEAACAEQEEDISNLQRLLGWLMANGVQGTGTANSKLGVYEAGEQDVDRGIVIFEDARQGELLLSIPLRLALTDHPGDQESNALLGNGSPWDIRLACKLLRHLAQGPASPWHLYLQVLPRTVGSAFGSWPSSVINELQLEGPNAALERALKFSPRSLSPPIDYDRATGGASPEQLRWAMSIVHSRTFGVAAKEGGVGTRMLVPLADFFNHGGDEATFLMSGPYIAADNVRWDIQQADEKGWRMDFTATRDVEEGEEALLSYSNQTGWDFFLHYGFVPRTPHEAVELFANCDSAIAWYLHRFPSQESTAAESVATAVRAAAAGEQNWPAAVMKDPEMRAQIQSLKLSAKGELDPRLMAAFTALTAAQQNGSVQQPNEKLSKQMSTVADSQQRSQAAMEASTSGITNDSRHIAAAERIVAARIMEMIYRPGCTSLLTDLKLLARSVELDEEESAQYERLFQHYKQVINPLEEKIAPLRNLVMSGREENQTKTTQPEHNEDFALLHIYALKLRALQKELLWNGLEWLLSRSFS